jgi:nuclear transcription Y subunit beta
MDREQEGAQGQGLGDFEVKEQDRWLPIANVARIMKMALPENAKIAKDTKECMQECVSEFISFITSEASEKCQQEKRKTVNGEDILFAMTTLGFQNYSEALKIYLSKYREIETHPNLQGPTTRADRPAAGAPRPVALAPIMPLQPAPAVTLSGNANSLLSPSHGLDSGDHDTTTYGYPGAVPTGHNGIGGDNY